MQGLENAKGIVRNIDNLGRVVIPVEIRNMLAVSYGSPVEIIEVDGGVFIKKHIARAKCCVCNKSGDLTEVYGHNICLKCAKDIIERFKDMVE